MNAHSWSKPRIIQSALRVLHADHININSLPFPVKYVRKSDPLLVEKLHVGVGVGVCGVCIRMRLYNMPRVEIVHVLYMPRADF